MILDIVNGYEIPFILPPRQSSLPNLCQLTKEASDLVDQEVKDMLRKGAIVVSDPKEDKFLSYLFLLEKKDGGGGGGGGGGGESPSSQPKRPEQKYSVSAFQDGRVVPIKGNVATRIDLIDLKDAYFAISLSVKSRIPVEKPSIRVLLPLLRAFSSSSGFYKAIKSPYLSLEKAQCKNNNLPRRHVTNGIFIRGLVDGKRYTDIHTSTLRFSDQYQKVLPRANIDFRISRGDSRFWGNDFEPSQGKTPQSTESLPGNPKKWESNSQGPKQIDWEVIIHSNSSPSGTRPLSPSSTSADSEINLSQLFRGENGNFGGGKKRTVMVERKLTLCNGRSLISSQPQIIISSDASLQAWGASCHGLTTGVPFSMEEETFHINVLELKAAKLAIMSFTLKERDATSAWTASAWTT